MKKYTIYSDNNTKTIVSQWEIWAKLIEIVTTRFETLGCNYLKVVREVNIIVDSLHEELVNNGEIEYHGIMIEECD